MKSKKRSRKTSRGKKSLDRVNVIIIILVLILVLFFLYNILIKEGDFLGELATVGPVGEGGIDLYAEATMRPGVTLPNEVEGCILELESPPYYRNPGEGRNRIIEEHILAKQGVQNLLGRDLVALGFDGEFTDAFNGMTFTEVSMDDCALLKSRISVVKEIHPNIQFTALLDESVKSIKGHLAYSEFGLSGEGVTIAVIDTGIDPNHESLDDMDDVNSGAVVGSVDEGQTASVNFKGKNYDVSILFIDNDEVVFNISGESAPSSGRLNIGDSFRLNDGKIITVRDISKLEIAGETGSASFSIGISSDTEDNDPKIIGWKDFVNFRPEPYDDHGHGTHCAGIAAGTGGVPLEDDLENGETVYRGVAPGAKLVGVKVLSRGGSGTFSQVIAGIEWTIQNKDKYDISVISMSLGASVNGDGTTPVEIAATTAAENGISFVVAAGNSGPRANSVGIPASAKKVIAVGAVDNNHDIARFSSRGPTKDDRIKPEVSAPGVSVMAPTANTYDSYHRGSGTSMATPHVAGVVALLKEADPELNTEEISELLKKTALDKGEKGEDNTYGWGVVDVLQALLEISPQEHELLIKDIVVKDLYDTNTPIRLNTVIENKGLNDEENVNVKLYVNNVEISNRDIDEFKSGSTESAEFIYFPKKEGVYEMKVVVDTVPGETIVFDNEYSREVVVKDFEGIVSAVVLDSWGSQYNVYTIFDYLMENWNDFGEYSLDIDYTSFNNKEITYEDLKANGAEVLIISNAWQDGEYDSGLNWEFSDSEIEAIKKYVGEGHGLVVTAGSLSINAPGNVENNMKLAPLVGIDETSEGYWADYMDDSSFNINYAKHHLFDNMNDYYSSYYTTKDLKLDKGDLLARSKDDLSIITGHHYGKGNTIYFANFPEDYRSYYSDKRAFYNALVWSTEMFEDNNINLRLENFEIDSLIKKGVQTNLKAQIVNQGGESQSEVIVKLLIDDNEIDIFQVESLASGESKEVTFSYIFEEVGSHNVEMIVDPLDNENKKYDNYLSKNVKVPRAFMTGNFVESTTDSDEDGLYDSLLINVEFEIFEEGHYDLSGLLTSQLGVELLQAYEWEFLEKGVNNLQLSFRGLDLRRWGLNGPYTLKNLRLYSEDERTNYDVEYQTEAYLADDFESYPDPSIDYINRNPWNPFVNDPVDIGIGLENIGIESSSEITVELYEREENSDILIGSTTTDGLGVFERSYVYFSVTPDKEGWIEYLVRITSEGDGNLENNLYYFDIRVTHDIPQLYSYWTGPYEVPIGQEFDIRANVYYNEGRPDVVEGVVVDLFKSVEVEGVRTLELIGSEEIGDLRKYGRGVAQFSYTPEDIGELRLIGKLRADNPINEDNSFTRYIQVMPNEADVLGDFTFKESYGIINTANIIYINVRNQGNNPARNVNVKLYDDGVEINDFSISRLGHGESVSLLSEWTPTTAREHELELVVTADEDADLTNNAYSEIINVLDKKTFNFNIMNLLRESIPRYLTLDGDRYFVHVIPFITEIADIEELDIGINNIYADDTSYKDAFTVLLGSELTENMDVTTEYYEDIKDKGLEFSFIYANNPKWSYDGLSYNLLYYDEEVGVEDMSVYECSDWNFVDKICNINWVLNEEELKVINRDGNFIMGESSKNDIQALGLTLKEGVLIDDEPLEKDDQDTTPASSSDISSDDTSSRRRSRGGASFASTGGNRISQSVYFSDKNAGETMKTKITNERLPIEYLEISFIGNQKRGYLHLNQVDTLEEIPSSGDNVYAYFSIDHHNINNNNIREGKMEFRVEKDWFTQRNVKKENVVLSRYSEGWEELPTSLLNSDDKYNYYTGEINGMSMFAISAKELEVVEIPIQVVDKKESKKLEADNNMWMIIGAAIIGILILVAIIVIVVLAERKKKKRLTAIKGMKWQGTNN